MGNKCSYVGMISYLLEVTIQIGID